MRADVDELRMWPMSGSAQMEANQPEVSGWKEWWGPKHKFPEFAEGDAAYRERSASWIIWILPECEEYLPRLWWYIQRQKSCDLCSFRKVVCTISGGVWVCNSKIRSTHERERGPTEKEAQVEELEAESEVSGRVPSGPSTLREAW